MCHDEWSRGPYGLDAEKGATVRVAKRVLVVLHHMTAANRLADVVPLIESDHRIQVVYTVAPASILSAGARRHLGESGAVAAEWSQIVQSRFDLAIAAGYGSLEHLHAPILIVPHGAGPSTLIHRWAGSGLEAQRPVAGLRPETIVAGGRVIPSVLAVARDEHRDLLHRACPGAERAVVVAGDPAFDRIAASTHLREAYREALGASPGQSLIVVSSTWGPRSLLGRHPGLPARLAAELPARTHRVVVVPHPNTWSWHGRRQLTAWMDDGLRNGMRLLPPETGWGAALVAADHLIGDHGSVGSYAAALGVPVTLAAFPDADVVPGSPAAFLGRVASRLDPDGPLDGLLDVRPRGSAAAPSSDLRAEITSRPGRSAGILRELMYGLLGLEEPQDPAHPAPLAPPRPVMRDLVR